MKPPRRTEPQSRELASCSAVLVLIYLLSTALHIWLLWEPSLFPHISSDEVQYSALGESLRSGRGYQVHGGFHSAVPPFYPLLVALAHSIGPSPRASMLVTGCLVMCVAMFPAFLIARYVGIGPRLSCLLAALASFLPHTFYAGTYMPETLQYPLFLAAFYIVLRWLDAPGLWMSLLLGGALGSCLLTKIQALQLIGAFLVTVPAQLYFIGTRNQRWAALRQVLLVIGTVAAMESVWLVYKTAQHAGVIGVGYERALQGGLSNWTCRLAAAYFADFLLAPGLIVAVPVACWLRREWGRRPAHAFFIASVLLVQVVVVSTLDGGLTGWLRERLFLYGIVLLAILAVRGMELVAERRTLLNVLTFFAVPTALLAVVLLYPFNVSSVIEVPWANALGSLNSGFEIFTKYGLLVNAMLAIIAGGILVLLSRRSAAVVLSAFLLLFHGCAFFASCTGLAEWSRMRRPEISGILGWLSSNSVPPGSRLLIAGRQAYFESFGRCSVADSGFLGRTFEFGLTETLEWQIETLGRFDVRMVESPTDLLCESRDGDSFLASTRFPRLDLVSVHSPLYLYRIAKARLAAGAPQYAADMPKRAGEIVVDVSIAVDPSPALTTKMVDPGFECYVDSSNDAPAVVFAGWVAGGTILDQAIMHLVGAGKERLCDHPLCSPPRCGGLLLQTRSNPGPSSCSTRPAIPSVDGGLKELKEQQ